MDISYFSEWARASDGALKDAISRLFGSDYQKHAQLPDSNLYPSASRSKVIGNVQETDHTTKVLTVNDPLAAPQETAASKLRKDCTVRDQQSYEATRAAAKARQALVDECILKQREAERQGDAVMVEHYRKESEQHMIILNLLNAQASEWVFWDKNQNVAADTVELHGLRVKEALERGVNAVREAEAAGKTQLVLIVGRGSHSDGGVAVLRPALQEELKRLGYDVSLHRGNEGRLIVRFDRY